MYYIIKYTIYIMKYLWKYVMKTISVILFLFHYYSIIILLFIYRMIM
jgi:hypothetical protein